MNILHYSDRFDNKLRESFDACDVLFTTGDLSYLDFSPIETLISTKPRFGVYGNHCIRGYLEKFGIQNVHLQPIEYNGIKIAGFQGCLRYKNSGEFQFTEEEAKKALSSFPGVDIFLLHAAPFGLLDTPGDIVHTGSHAVREYIERTKPRYVFCGHDSPSEQLEYEGIKIYRTDGTKIIEINL